MKYKVIGIILVCLAIPSLSAVAAGGDAAESKSASVHVVETRYDFGSVVEGEKVLHDFQIRNKGTTAFNVTNVRTD